MSETIKRGRKPRNFCQRISELETELAERKRKHADRIARQRATRKQNRARQKGTS